MRLSTMVGICMGVVALASGLMAERVITPQWRTWTAARSGLVAAHLAQLALTAATRISAERGPTNGILGADLPIPPERGAALAASRRATDQSLAAVEAAIGDFSAAPAVHAAIDAARQKLAKTRVRLDALVRLPRAARPDDEVRGVVTGMIAVIPELAPALNVIETALVAADPTLTNFVTVARLSTEMRDWGGQLGSVLTAPLVGKRPMAADELASWARISGVIEALNQHLRLAYAMTGGDPAIERALGGIDQHFLGAGLALVTQLAASGRDNGDYAMTSAEFASAFVPEMVSIIDLRDAASGRIVERMSIVDGDSRRALVSALVSAALGAAAVLAAYAVILLRISRPLGAVSRALREMASGKADVDVPASGRGDEIGDLITALRSLQSVVRERETETWVKSEVAAAIAQVRTAEDFESFAHALLSQLSRSVGLLYGSFFVADGGILTRVGAFAAGSPAPAPPVAFGEGLIGQAALERRPLTVDTATGGVRIVSGLGELGARQLLVVPVLSQGNVVAVVELAPVRPLSEPQQALLTALMPVVAVHAEMLGRNLEARSLARQ